MKFYYHGILAVVFYGIRMTIGAAIASGESFVTHRVSRHLECQMLLAHVLKLSKEQVFCSINRELNKDEEDAFFALVAELKTGRPVAQLLGEREFYGLMFEITPDVLVPRPETELMVDAVKRLAHEHYPAGEFVCADVGTGCGCIGISIAHLFPRARVVLSDISSAALAVASRNVERHELTRRVELVCGDLLEPVIARVSGSASDSVRPLDFVVANLPYIGEEEFRFVAHDVEQFEPHVALFGGSDGLQLYKKMFQQIVSMPVLPRFVLGEFGFAQSELIESMLHTFFDQYGASLSLVPDYAGIDRHFIVSLPSIYVRTHD